MSRNPFANWSDADVARHNSRIIKVPVKDGPEIAFAPKIKREAELHEQIFCECRRRGWVVFHGAMSERTHRTAGEPDFIILCDSGRVLLIECKTATGKLSPDQLAIKAWAAKLGHTVHVVRSIEEFFTTLNDRHRTSSTLP
ncbi:MAG TPA: VRR-NUC domain-containing protein [Verrucomicrobiae bacterium]|nr:VRR-NUC domain-containing protein [Verrucomicrobiae bacterium]